jgi:small-conductance mechanosensitive channel
MLAMPRRLAEFRCLPAAVLAAWLAVIAAAAPPVAAQGGAPVAAPAVTAPVAAGAQTAPPPATAASSEAGAAGTSPSPPASAAAAAAAAAEVVVVDPAAEARLANWRATLDQITAALARTDLEDAALELLRREATVVRDEAAEASLLLAPRIKAAEVRLGQLAQPQDAAGVESDLVRRDRDLETRGLAALRAVDQQAQVQRLRAEELAAQITERRRALFAERLFERRVSVLDPVLWVTVAAELPRAATSARLLVEDWAGAVVDRAGRAAAALILLVAVGGIVVYAVLRHRLLAIASRVGRKEGEVPALKRALAACAIVIANTAIPVLGLLLLRFALEAMDVLPVRIERVLRGVTIAVGFFSFGFGLARGLLAPGRPQWRLVDLPEPVVDPAVRWILVGAGAFALGIALLTAASVLALPVVVTVAVQAVVAVAIAVVTALLLRALSRGFSAGDDEPPDEAGSRWRWLIPLGWLVVAATLAAALAGYLALAWFLATQIVWTAAVLGSLLLLLVLVDEATTAGFRSGTSVGRFLSANFGLSYTAIGQIGVLLSGVVRLLLIVIAVLLIIGRLGFSSADLSSVTATVVSGLSIGGITLSPTAILGAIVLFVLGVAATRGLQHWLDQRYLPRTRLDVGLKTSIRTGVGYVGTIAAGMIAFAFAGLDLQNIAIVAGALSVGIGFGLQSIVNNFVSGLILLAERPIKVGDWIVVGPDEGTVKRINVRSTEIETFDRATVIVPNSSLISGTVKNWMHHDLTGRVMLPVGVDYDADPEKVIAILLACARAHPQVLAYPQPFAQFTGFGASALDFVLFCYVGNVGNMGGVRSDLRVEVLQKFRAEGIDIPHVTSDVNIRDFDRIEALVRDLLLKRGDEAPGGGAASTGSAKPTDGA